MGLLRLLLAITVVIDHSRSTLFGFTFVGSRVAVQTFFMISGFYMAYILNEKYTGPGSYRTFITNRFLRLFPVYWAVLALIIAASIISLAATGNGFGLSLYEWAAGSARLPTLIYLAATNLFIFGQDAVWFLSINTHDGALYFTTDFENMGKGYAQAVFFLFIPQAWTIGLELTFYLIAPFIVRRSALLVLGIAGASLLLRIYLLGNGLDGVAWQYRFFPTELALFLIGAASYRLYGLYRRLKVGPIAFIGAYLAAIAATIGYQFAPIAAFEAKRWVYYAAMALLIPGIFIYSRERKLDNFLGELSYPLYLGHVLIWYVTAYQPRINPAYYTVYYYGSIGVTIVVTLALARYVAGPIERYRQSRVKSLARQ